MTRRRTPLLLATLAVCLAPAVAHAGPISDQVDYGLKATTAWDAGYTGEGQTIAVIDTGTDARHPWFNGQVVSEACFTSMPQKDLRPTCPGLGTYGSDPLVKGPVYGPGAAMPPSSGWGLTPEQWAKARTYHGTAVAGIAAGGQQFAFGYRIGRRGIAPDADVIAVNAFAVQTDGQGAGSPPDLLASLQWVNEQRAQHNIAVVNLSWTYEDIGGDSGPCDADAKLNRKGGAAAVRDAINELVANGVTVVAAAGNHGGTAVGFPACLSNVIAVGGTDTDNGGLYVGKADGTGTPASTQLTVLAPATRITGPRPGGTSKAATGTSYAAPLVSGAIALYKQKYPSATPQMIRNALKTSGPTILVRPGIRRRVLQVDDFLDLKPGPIGAVNESCLHLAFQPAEGRPAERDAFVRLTCAPAKRRPGKLVITVTGPNTDVVRAYTDVPLADTSYYANRLVKFGVPRFRPEPGLYQTCYLLYGTEDKIYPLASSCREDEVG